VEAGMTVPIKRDTLSEQVANWLVEYIYRENLRPNDPLPAVGRLAEQLQVSAPIVREAYKTLQGRGVIEIVNGRTARVKPLDNTILHEFFQRARIFHKESFNELIEVRRGLEIQSAMLAAQRRSEADLAAMKATITGMRQQLHNSEAFADLDVAFHLQIAASTGNSLLAALISSIRASLRESILFGMQRRASAQDLEEVQQCHEKILEAIIAQDAAQASRMMTHHFDVALAAVLKEG
jgi:DNA-binding FadR family transcriptional regulator